ncbi:hypothetical protein ACA758_02720 [Mycoplasmopsis agassizii]|uniref:hypothetical protein n=1 Tax=Mycoplasmopsis agassizii TaxID=33922 RepID=UPI00352941C4
MPAIKLILECEINNKKYDISNGTFNEIETLNNYFQELKNSEWKNYIEINDELKSLINSFYKNLENRLPINLNDEEKNKLNIYLALSSLIKEDEFKLINNAFLNKEKIENLLIYIEPIIDNKNEDLINSIELIIETSKTKYRRNDDTSKKLIINLSVSDIQNIPNGEFNFIECPFHKHKLKTLKISEVT